jgi:cytochrome c oxidase subunit 3
MAGAKNHPYHILPASIWPLVGAFAAMAMASGAVMWMHDYAFGGYVFFAGLIAVLFVMFSWWADVVREAHAGDHTPIVQLHLRYGMILFIASEVMFFVAWFWAWFNAALFPSPWNRSAASGRRRGWKCWTRSVSRSSTP